MLKKILLGLGLSLLLLIVVLLVRTYSAAPVALGKAGPAPQIDTAAITRLAGAIQIKTISFDDETLRDTAAWRNLHNYLARMYPLVHKTLQREVVAGYSLLYTWRGTDASAKPIILMGHQDVVPVEPETLGKWDADPFGGVVKDGYLYGRGTLDDKVNILAILEAAEALLAKGFRPKGTIYFAFGHDEEVLGVGAAKLSELLQSRGVQAQFVLDEGLVVGTDFLPVAAPISFVGVAEKGYASFELSVAMPGGHSSYPTSDNAITILADAIEELNTHQMPLHMTPPVAGLLQTVGPHMGFANRLAIANQWLSQGYLMSKFAASNTSNAMVRTTTAATIFRAGEKDNVVPNVATATVNFRLLPGDKVADVAAHIRSVVQDSLVTIRQVGPADEASAVSSSQSAGYKVLERAILSSFPESIVAPSLVIGATDSRHFAICADDVYRFMPVRLSLAEIKGIHGINERISLAGYSEAIGFYSSLMQEASK